MKILITAPSLNPTENVSGISSVVQSIISYNKEHEYFHYKLGRSDRNVNKLILIFNILIQLIYFPIFLYKNRIDIVHQNLPFNSKGLIREFIINFICRLCNVKVIVHVHGGEFLMKGTPNKLYKVLAKSLFSNSSKVIVLSEIEREAIKNQFAIVNPIVLYNSIDTRLFAKNRKYKQNGKPVILFLGRIHESKGLEDIVEAFKLLRKRCDFKFVLCGNGPLKNYAIYEFTKLLGDDFEYKGIISGAIKLEVIKNADYFILPSRYGEGLPIALLETMAAGLVPIVTDDASMKYVVEHKRNGIRVEKYSPLDIATKIEEVFNNEFLYNTLSINAQSEVANNFDIKLYVSQLNSIYKSIK